MFGAQGPRSDKPMIVTDKSRTYKVWLLPTGWITCNHKDSGLPVTLGRGQPQKTHSLSKIAKWGFLTLGFSVFLGLNLRNAIIIFILYLKSKDSVTLIIMLL